MGGHMRDGRTHAGWEDKILELTIHTVEFEGSLRSHGGHLKVEGISAIKSHGGNAVQGYPAHKKPPTPLRSPLAP